MSLVRMHNAKRNVTYVYESESYWDREKKQARSHRRLVGKVDPETGEIVPTGPRGRRPAEPPRPEGRDGEAEALRRELDSCRAELDSCRAELDRRGAELAACRDALERIASIAAGGAS